MESNLDAKILRRRKHDRSSTLFGLIAGVLLGGAAFQWIKLGKIPIVEEFARQLGLRDFLLLFQLVLVFILAIIFLQGVRALLRTRLEVSGSLTFHPDGINIKKGKYDYELSGQSLQAFSIRLPEKIDASNNKLSGGCHLMIPSPEGTFKCEFELANGSELERLQELLKHIEQVHQIKIDRDS